jgi:hypothetical protein
MDTTAISLGIAGLLTTLGGALGAPWVAARWQVAVTRDGDLRATLDDAAVCLATAEARGRDAWRALLDLQIASDDQLDDVLRDRGFGLDFPKERSASGETAVGVFATELDAVRAMSMRLIVRLGERAPPVKAFVAARDHLSSIATTMGFGAQGAIGIGGDDFESTTEEFFVAVTAAREFLSAARHALR